MRDFRNNYDVYLTYKDKISWAEELSTYSFLSDLNLSDLNLSNCSLSEIIWQWIPKSKNIGQAWDQLNQWSALLFSQFLQFSCNTFSSGDMI